ncbi:right-handed parallel beta-helix repeat-containing protein [Dyadobacter pollutisoli]|uniref:Right-handed parallel beta-helix repeat-containing protein n=1 Tax=Dyadobacter pollutisoli TaxID=2910158 RepID=A0A9E8SLW0_9BACT|nr:right-handed parallel beta-helix repeat-containing protein [Dyadobacter pollutisoli]WAC13518.1 right-handed parallel beta-helix repeat-containing protein [Dyadobacter pollutisoli]
MLVRIFSFFFVISLLSCKKPRTVYPKVEASSRAVYYVSPSGNDSEAGTISAPFQSINKALNVAAPGDTVFVRKGAFHEKIIFPKSGRPGKYVTLKAFPGEAPAIDGTGLTVTGKDALVMIRNVNYIILEGFTISNFKSSAPWVDVNGIIVDGTSAHITIRKNKVFNIENNAAAADGRSGHGIEVRGNTNTAITDILIEENEIHDCNTGYSENLTINGHVDGFTIRKNKIYNGENIGIVAAGGYAANSVPAYNFAKNGLISENEVYNLDGTKGPVPAYSQHNGAIGIYVDGARNIIVERNKVHDNGRGIGIVSETNNFPTRDCIVRNNFVYNNSLGGIYLGGYIGYTGGGTRNCYVINNTTFFNNRDLGYSGEIEGEIRITADCHDNVIHNNILYARAEKGVFINKQSTDGSNNRIDYNIYFSTGINSWSWNNIAYNNFSAWQAACQDDASSLAGIDPNFINIKLPDLHILPTSPARNSGILISSDIQGDEDIDGGNRVINNRISRGAHQLP